MEWHHSHQPPHLPFSNTIHPTKSKRTLSKGQMITKSNWYGPEEHTILWLQSGLRLYFPFTHSHFFSSAKGHLYSRYPRCVTSSPHKNSKLWTKYTVSTLQTTVQLEGTEWLPLSDILGRNYHLQCASLAKVFFHLHTVFRFPHSYTKKKTCHKWSHHCAVNANFTQNCSTKIVWGFIKNSVSLYQSKPWFLKTTAKQANICLQCKRQHKLASN